MATYEASVHITTDLHQYGEDNYNDGYIAQDRAATYIQGAFDRSSHTVYLNTPPERPNPGAETIDTEYTAACPCNTSFNCTYNSVVGYYKDWLDCHSYESKDVNIVISSTSNIGGGETCGCGTHAHSQSGQKICDLDSSYQDYGFTDPFNAMQTSLHEIGHLLLKAFPSDDDGDGETQHDMAFVYNHVDGNAVSPMYVNGDENNCSTPVDQIASGKEMRWSGCCEDYWRAPF